MARKAWMASVWPSDVVIVHVTLYITPNTPPVNFCETTVPLAVALPEITLLGLASVPLNTAQVQTCVLMVSLMARFDVKSNAATRVSLAYLLGSVMRPVIVCRSIFLHSA